MEQRKWYQRKPETILDWMLIIFSSIALYIFFVNFPKVKAVANQLMDILAPFAAGIVIAYVVNPIVEWTHKHILRSNPKLRWLAMLTGYVVAVTIVVGMLYLIVTQVFKGISEFADDISKYARDLKLYLTDNESSLPEWLPVQQVIHYLDDLTELVEKLLQWVITKVLATRDNLSYEQIITGAIEQTFGTLANAFMDVFTAVAASVYVLIQKKTLLRQSKIITRAFLPRRVANNVLRICEQGNRNLTRYFTGKVIDSAIVGLLLFVLMTIFRMRFATVISIIVGVTDIIPVFGPFIGAAPSILLLLFVDPLQALGFAVMLLFIQQLDGNFLAPKILGDAIGIDALWVLFSIVVGGAMFGLVGMVVGVPVFATMYSVFKEFTEWCLRRKGIDKDGNPLGEPAAVPAAAVPAAESAPAAESVPVAESAPAAEPATADKKPAKPAAPAQKQQPSRTQQRRNRKSNMRS